MEEIILDEDLRNNSNIGSENFPKLIPVWKFVLLNVLTFNLYGIYWFYHFWTFVKNEEKSDIMPIWRSIFVTFFMFSVVDRIAAYAKEVGIHSSMNSVLIGCLFFILNGLGRLPDPYWIIVLFTSLILIQPVSVFNMYLQKKGQPVASSFSKAEMAILIIGGIFIALIIAGLFINE